MSKHQELFSLFHHKVMGTTDPDVKIGKPAPDIFLVAARRFPNPPKPSDVRWPNRNCSKLVFSKFVNIIPQCLVFEDAPNGVRAACLADMQSVMVPDVHVSEELRKEATLVIGSLEQFEPELFGLPPFSDASNNNHWTQWTKRWRTDEDDFDEFATSGQATMLVVYRKASLFYKEERLTRDPRDTHRQCFMKL